ncbi:hypothetical protein TREES_T100020651 [Tupaia chinensis]|uniref:Uncharacterized protein n=1 Tax=Tupaia chinensis TaxID=246437 RepID=L9KLD3_TUPCH|nr:hypothetical protein TREES_T100020651 [Tupaia chinensis]
MNDTFAYFSKFVLQISKTNHFNTKLHILSLGENFISIMPKAIVQRRYLLKTILSNISMGHRASCDCRLPPNRFLLPELVLGVNRTTVNELFGFFVAFEKLKAREKECFYGMNSSLPHRGASSAVSGPKGDPEISPLRVSGDQMMVMSTAM